jgi:5-methylcytosine-specific restriction endonuclease McrA
LGAFVADVDPTEVWIRDEGIRHICEVAIDPDLPWPHKFSKTLDHVVPLAKGGTHQPENVRLAHAVCNSRKNDRTA